jgi:hypothetical protein
MVAPLRKVKDILPRVSDLLDSFDGFLQLFDKVFDENLMIVKVSLRELFTCRRRDGPVAGANFVQVIATQSAQGAKGRAPIDGAGHGLSSRFQYTMVYLCTFTLIASFDSLISAKISLFFKINSLFRFLGNFLK